MLRLQRICNNTRLTNLTKSLITKTRIHSKYQLHTDSKSPNVSIRNKRIGKWFLGCSGMVFVAVGLGGYTRLTESGLSMVTWKLMGEHMPRNQEEWITEFSQYQQYPEFKLKNSSMTLEEFKFIYLMEYIHRMWGRTIGGFFFLPAVYFWNKGYFCSKTKKYVILLGTLIAAQGLMGWYMVKSGLEDRFQDVSDVPRVSQYRLASHLSAAFVLYAIFFSKALQNLLPAETFLTTRKVLRIKTFSHLTKSIVFLTAISGAFVAGLDAGLVYNSFPKMGDNWIPEDFMSFEPAYVNFTENPTTVQFDHRVLGISTVALTSFLWLFSRRTKLPRRAVWAINSVAAMAWLQASLGVTTLLNYVPVPLATAHQSGSLILLSLSLWLGHELRFLKYIPK